MSKPVIDLNWDQLDKLCRLGLRLKDCAQILSCSHDVIERRIKRDHDMTFEEYKDSQMSHTRRTLISKAIEMADGGNVTMLIFCLKNLAGWTDKVEHGFDKEKRTIMLKYNLEEKINEMEKTATDIGEIKDVTEIKKDT